MKLFVSFKDALPGAARILLWALPIWLIGFIYLANFRLPLFATPAFYVWLIFYFLAGYIVSRRDQQKPSQTLEEKGQHISGGVLRR